MDNIHIEYCNSGIIKVIINTNERWCDYSIWENSNGDIVFEEKDSDGFTDKIYRISVDFTPNTRYTRIDDQEKDQVYIYFIPTDMI